MTARVMRAALDRAVVSWLMLFALFVPAFAAAGDESEVEQRVALVIGNAAYKGQPLDNPVNDARLVASSLRRAGFQVDLRENLGRLDLLAALRDFAARLNENTAAVLYYAGHGLQLRDRNYLIPVDADIRSEDEIPVSGIDLSFALGRMSHARSRVNVIILDACRNNPFAGKTVPAQVGLAQMDAPVGTLLAYATAPGKVAADGAGSNSLYATYLAKHMATPGLPVELMFKRVREEVVRESRQQQVPWESSSLQGEFAFVPARPEPTVAQTPPPAAAPVSPAGAAPAIAIAAPNTAGSVPPPAVPMLAARLAAAGGRPELLPHVGDSWRYRVRDQFRLGDLFVDLRVEGLTADGVLESWTTTADPRPRSLLAAVNPSFSTLPDWTLTPPEFAPYLQALGPLKSGQPMPASSRLVDSVPVTLRASVEGEEEVSVGAGRFQAVRLQLRGQAQARGGAGVVTAEYTVWYSPQVKRPVKVIVSTRVGGQLREATSFELAAFKLN